MVLKQIADDLYSGEAEQVAAFVRQALEEGMEPVAILNEGLLAGMEVVGRDFKADILFLPEVLVSARAMHAGMDILRPYLGKSEVQPLGHFVIGTVEGDLHDIGKNLVAMMMEGAGIQVTDLGINVSANEFVDVVREKGPQIVGLSALLTTTMGQMGATIRALQEADLRSQVKIVVGGAPITQSFADEIGADGYAPDAISAVELAKGWLKTI
jgi:5-methyltetrahydrofolate--homocysteine methyltransferase